MVIPWSYRLVCDGCCDSAPGNEMKPRLNKIKDTAIDIVYWSIINIAVIAYVLSCDRVNSSRNLNN